LKWQSPCSLGRRSIVSLPTLTGCVTDGGSGVTVVRDPLLAKQTRKCDVVDSSSLYLCHVARFWGVFGAYCFHFVPKF